MTHRLYYTDPYTTDFEATILAVEPDGVRSLVRLDRSSFYPTSGGQPCDTGLLADAPVVDVYEDAGGDVVHVLKEAPPLVRPGERIRGAVGWRRRFDHMQQHTGQHVLSAACDRLFGARTTSFHLGVESSTIDVDRELTATELTAAEEEANRVVWDDRPVTIRFVTDTEAAQLPLRKAPSRQGTLRVIEIEQFDLSACGGTHVARTGAVGLIGVTTAERFKGGQRLTFVCGGRALAQLRADRAILAATGRVLSVVPTAIPSCVERLHTEARHQKRTIDRFKGELARYRAEALVAAAEPSAGPRLVLQAVDADASELKALAAAVTAAPGLIAVLVSTATPALVVVARSPDVGVPSHEVLGALLTKFGGRGGGKADLAQAGGVAGAAPEILAEARRVIDRSRPLDD